MDQSSFFLSVQMYDFVMHSLHLQKSEKYRKFRDVGLPYEEKLDLIFSGLKPASTMSSGGGTGAPIKYIDGDSEGEPEIAAAMEAQFSMRPVTPLSVNACVKP